MRTLLILRGCMGSGKTKFIKDNGLTNYTISADDLRLLFHSPKMNEDGGMSISSRADKQVWDTLYLLLENRMKNGDFTIIDATHKNQKAVSKYIELAEKYRYNCYQVNIEASLQECIERNNMREEIRRVPNSEIERAYEILQSNKLPSKFKEVTNINDILNYYVTDVNEYKEIKVIGDVHGSHTCLLNAIGETLDPQVLYVFVGDYFDRGIENKEVYEFLVNYYNDSNVILIEGNHEKHIWRFINGETITSDYFKESLDEILKTHSIEMVRKNMKKIYYKLRQCFAFTYNNKKYLVTHGGLTSVPSLTLISTNDMIKGVGGYDMEVDRIYEENYLLGKCQDFIQIHGHRNTISTEHSICLEDSVEFGGNLLVMSITKEGNRIIPYENKVFSLDNYNKFQQTVYNVDNQEVKKMMNSRLVNVKGCKHNMYSLNFTRNAFFGKKWDFATIKARGLFVDRNTGDVKMRSYDKFFNLNEHETTKKDVLTKTLKFPVSVSVKENGYLGILSVVDNQPVFASKSTDSGEYAERFERIFKETISKNDFNILISILKKYNASAIFEVISPNEDPHIIRYNEEHVVLLDIIQNKLNLDSDYNEISSELKEWLKEKTSFIMPHEIIIDNSERLWDYIQTHSVNDNDIEGVVVTDSKGFKFKVKYNYYLMVKSLRKVLEIFRKCKKNGTEFNNKVCSNNLELSFLNFIEKEDDGVMSIIDLYDKFKKKVENYDL